MFFHSSVHMYTSLFANLPLYSMSEHCVSICIKVPKTSYYQGLLMDLVYVLPIATCSSQILLGPFLCIQLIWIYTVCKGRVYLGSAGKGNCLFTATLVFVFILSDAILISCLIGWVKNSADVLKYFPRK